LAWPAVMALAYFAGWVELNLLGRHFTFFAVGAGFAIARVDGSWIGKASLGLAMLLALHFAIGQAERMTLDKGVDYSPWAVAAIILTMFGFFALASTRWGANL